MGKSGGISEANVGSILLLMNIGVLAWTTFIGLRFSPLINVIVLGTLSRTLNSCNWRSALLPFVEKFENQSHVP